jgi:hypothetical protein
MITWIRTANTIPGKIGEAVAWSKGVTAAVKRVTGKDLTVSVAFGGPTGGLSWIMHFENAAQVEEANSKMMADRDYQNLLGQAHAFFVPNTGHDQMWRQVQM